MFYCWQGYARMHHVQFEHMGQEGWTDFYDPRYAVAYVNTGPIADNKPSEMVGCTMKDSFNTGIGVFGASGLTFRQNVIHKTVGSGE